MQTEKVLWNVTEKSIVTELPVTKTCFCCTGSMAAANLPHRMTSSLMRSQRQIELAERAWYLRDAGRQNALLSVLCLLSIYVYIACTLLPSLGPVLEHNTMLLPLTGCRKHKCTKITNKWSVSLIYIGWGTGEPGCLHNNMSLNAESPSSLFIISSIFINQ